MEHDGGVWVTVLQICLQYLTFASVIHREFAHRLLIVKNLNVLIGNVPEEFLYNRGSTMAANAPITVKEALTVRLAVSYMITSMKIGLHRNFWFKAW